tara:strand:+ start:664 stop:1227 length:564 start_codon:yes stop_codon:yes gene_type:complete
MNQKIELWFPTPIYYVDNLLGNDLKKYQDLFVNRKYDTYRNDYMNVETSHSRTDPNIHHLDEFKPVIDKITMHVHTFANKLGYKGKREIDTSWTNKSYKDDYLYPHVHGNCLISGAYYIKSSEEDKITFMKNMYDMKAIPEEENELNFRNIEYPCKTDRLILFFSDTLHMTYRQKSDFKMALSFNYK